MYKQYRRIGFTEARPVTVEEIAKIIEENPERISISEEDIKNGSPKLGDMIAQNPLNTNDKWLISEEYFQKNFIVVEN